MHPAAFNYVALFRSDDNLDVLDIGGRDVNGSPRSLFPNADYLAVDLRDGPGVDIVADVTTWKTRKRFDLVICCEVFEHTSEWPLLVAAAHRLLRKGGRLVATCAGPGRAPHSAEDGSHLRDGEHYENVTPEAMLQTLHDIGFSDFRVVHTGGDLQATAVKQ